MGSRSIQSHFDVTLGLHWVYEGGLRTIFGLNWLQAHPTSSNRFGSLRVYEGDFGSLRDHLGSIVGPFLV